MKQVSTSILARIIRPLRTINSVDRVVTRAFQEWYEMPFSPIHYYSPLPDVPVVKRNLPRWYSEEDLAGIRLEGSEQNTFLESLTSYTPECLQLPSYNQLAAGGWGEGYGEVEALFLYCAVRHLKPCRIIEVGGGISTYFSLNALEMNGHSSPAPATFICIEPFPHPQLYSLHVQGKVKLYEKQVQDIDLRVFQDLKASDILFIDSSHVGKVDSDVYFLLFRVLPHLKKGVIIHFHDIPFPYLTCPPAQTMFTHSIFWNEAAMLRAFLMWNAIFEVLVCQSYLHFRSPELIKKIIPIYDENKHYPTALWMRKVE